VLAEVIADGGQRIGQRSGLRGGERIEHPLLHVVDVERGDELDSRSAGVGGRGVLGSTVVRVFADGDVASLDERPDAVGETALRHVRPVGEIAEAKGLAGSLRQRREHVVMGAEQVARLQPPLNLGECP